MTTSKYARKFDSNCASWMYNAEFNKVYLRSKEAFFNDLLRMRGYVFLRDIYEELGFPISEESIVVGWYYNPKDKTIDNYISFDIRLINDTSDFMLDFNVDGDIRSHFNKG